MCAMNDFDYIGWLNGWYILPWQILKYCLSLFLLKTCSLITKPKENQENIRRTKNAHFQKKFGINI